jgi:hypothetical protein
LISIFYPVQQQQQEEYSVVLAVGNLDEALNQSHHSGERPSRSTEGSATLTMMSCLLDTICCKFPSYLLLLPNKIFGSDSKFWREILGKGREKLLSGYHIYHKSTTTFTRSRSCPVKKTIRIKKFITHHFHRYISTI